MKPPKRLALALFFIAAAMPMVSRCEAALLEVYAINSSNLQYVTSAPYLKWSAATITNNQTNWIYADQFLIIRTDQKYRVGTWSVQVFTDNTQVADAKAGNPPFHIPDWWVGNVFHAGGTTTGPLTPKYLGNQAYSTSTVAGTPTHYPKNGLISADGESRIPLTWRIYDALPSGNHPAAIVEDADHTPCDFADCAWAYFLDKGDQKRVNGGDLGSDWDLTCAPLDSPTRVCYSVPLSQDGYQRNIGSRVRPTYSGDGTVSEYLFVASNFRNGTRQMYSTTIFVELLTF